MTAPRFQARLSGVDCAEIALTTAEGHPVDAMTLVKDAHMVGALPSRSAAPPKKRVANAVPGFLGRVVPRLTELDFQQIVKSLLSVSDPAAIVLFGSYARGDVHPYSDIDLMVLRRRDFRGGESRRKELGLLYRSVTEICDTPKDIVLFTLNEYYSWRETTNHMIAVAWKEGRVLYGQV